MDINRKTAYLVLMRMEEDEAYSNLELNHQIRENNPSSPGFVRELVYGVIENRLFLDYYIKQLLKKGGKKVPAPARVLIRMGIYQLLFMDSVPEYAAVNESVNLAKKYCFHQKALVNGVLRNFLREKDHLKSPAEEKNLVNRLSYTYSFSPWITKLWLAQFGETETENLMKASNAVPPVSVRVNRRKVRPEELERSLREHDEIEVTLSSLTPWILHLRGPGILDLSAYEQGLFSVQDVGSYKAVETLDPQEGELVIDVCAAPGGKSLACAEHMNNQGTVLSFDIHPEKLQGMHRNAKRLGIDIIQSDQNDACKPLEAYRGKADRVLCDVPCSGLGVLRRKPEIKYKEVPKSGAELAEKQYEILAASESYLKPGGFLVYSTCTINRIENQEVVDRFLKEHPQFEMIESRQLLPTEHQSDGFYYCLMKKTQE